MSRSALDAARRESAGVSSSRFGRGTRSSAPRAETRAPTWAQMDAAIAAWRAGRTVPLAPALVKHLRACRAEDDAARWVVPSNRTGATPRLARQRDAVRAWQRSGVPPEVWAGQSFHAFRKGLRVGADRGRRAARDGGLP